MLVRRLVDKIMWPCYNETTTRKGVYIMKRLFIVFLCPFLLLSLFGCKKDDTDDQKAALSFQQLSVSYDTPCSKEGVTEFMELFGGPRDAGGLMTGVMMDEESCYNVTSPDIAEKLGFQIYKFSSTCMSFAVIDGHGYQICGFFGGYGFVNAVPCDFDKNGSYELLIASSWGSGLHRSEIFLFDPATKESAMLFDTTNEENPSLDLFLSVQALPSGEECYVLHTTEIELVNENFADISCQATGAIGYLISENGAPKYIPLT